MSEPRVFYFGAWSREKTGHYFYGPRGSELIYCVPGYDSLARRALENSFPGGRGDPDRPWAIDAGFCPDPKCLGGQVQGICNLTRTRGWSVASWWDRTADRRSNSNSSFLVEGEWPLAEVIRLGLTAFPEVAERLRTAGVELRVPGPPAGGAARDPIGCGAPHGDSSGAVHESSQPVPPAGGALQTQGEEE